MDKQAVSRQADGEDNVLATNERTANGWRRQMAAAFFSINQDGILVYDDPVIGALKSRRGIEVCASATAARLDVVASGRVVRSFSLLDGNARDACLAAAGEYFRLVQESAFPLALVA